MKIITPVITVFDQDEKPNYEGNKKVIDFLIKGGVDGILVLGSAGEFPNLSIEERLEFMKFYAEYVSGRVELFVGTGCVSYQDTLKLSKEAIKLGLTPMIIGPYYYGIDQEKLFIYYDRLAKELDGDIYLYSYPARTGHSLEPETIGKLVRRNPNIKGIKESISEPNHTNRIFREIENYDFTVYSGFDDQFLANASNNGGGCIGALSIIVPELWHDLVLSYNKKNYRLAIKLYNLIQKLMPIYDMDTNCSLIMKKLLVHRGVKIDDRAVFPFNQISETTLSKAKTLLDAVLTEYKNLLKIYY